MDRHCCEHQDTAGIRLVVLNLPEDEGEGLGFRLTRTLWDPYPWVHDVTLGSRADGAGLKAGDCLLQADGKDLLGLPVGQVAGIIRGNGASHGVSLLVWNCGVDPKDDPELLWSVGGGSRGEKSRRALSSVVKALSCCVCSATASSALNCARSHLYCEGCWSRLEKCALCREPLPAKESPYAKNLVAEQVFEAIAIEYEIKDATNKNKSLSAYNSPNRSPQVSPSPLRKGQYHLSMMSKKYNHAIYSSDPNLRKSCNDGKSKTTLSVESTSCKCQNRNVGVYVPQKCQDTQGCHIQVENGPIKIEDECGSKCNLLQHKLVTRLRQACSMADLQNFAVQKCHLSKSMNNINISDKSQSSEQVNSSSMDNLKANINHGDSPVFLLSPPPIYVLSCDH